MPGSPRRSTARLASAVTRRGTVTLIRGCMFSGKTSELLRRLDEAKLGAALAFKHDIDTRYSPDAVVSHAGKARPATAIARPGELLTYIHDSLDLIGLDEAHFFDETLADVVQSLRQRGFEVILTALDRDSWGRPFPVVEQLTAIADRVNTKTATCARCGAPADRTQRLTPIVNACMVGGPESYEPRCATCWHPPPEAAP